MEKERKYQLILDKALAMYTRDRTLPTAAEICREVGIAKGTLYLYFEAKEEIYMEILVRKFRAWHTTLREFILDRNPQPADLVLFMVTSLGDYWEFVDLVTVSSALLEEHVPLDFLREFRGNLRQETERTCKLMAVVFQLWSEDECRRNLRRFYSFGFGYWRECFPPPKVMAAFPKEFSDLDRQREKFFDELLEMNRLIWNTPVSPDFKKE